MSSRNQLSAEGRKIFRTGIGEIEQRSQHQVLEYNNIDPQVGFLVAQSLSEHPAVESSCARVNFNSVTGTLWIIVMSTFLHDVHQKWLKNAVLDWLDMGMSKPEAKYLNVAVGTTITGFDGDYSLSQKEPDAFISANTQKFPRIAIEVGWSESMPRLEADMRLWLLGARAHVQRVIILKWTKITRERIKGFAFVYGRDSTGNPTRLQKLDIFPAPTGPEQQVSLTRRQLFGEAIFAGTNADEVFYLRISELRKVATPWIQDMGCTPA